MNERFSERLKVVLDGIIDGYENLKSFESNGTEKENLRQELINIRNACEEIPIIFAETAREVGLDIEKLTPFANFLKVDFVNAIKLQLLTITEPSIPTTKDWAKMQGNLAVTMMNMNGQIDQIRIVRKLLG